MLKKLRIGIAVLFLCGALLYSFSFRQFSATLSKDNNVEHHPILSKQNFVQSPRNTNARNLSESNAIGKNTRDADVSRENHNDERVERKDTANRAAIVVPMTDDQVTKPSDSHPSLEKEANDNVSMEKVTHLDGSEVPASVKAMEEPPLASVASNATTIHQSSAKNVTASNHAIPIEEKARVTNNSTNSTVAGRMRAKNRATTQQEETKVDLEQVFEQALADLPLKGQATVLRELQAKLASASVGKEDVQRIMSQVMFEANKHDVDLGDEAMGNGRLEKLRLKRNRKRQQQQQAEAAEQQQQDESHQVVPIRDPLAHHPKKGSVKRLPFNPQVPYLGVLVDAGRQYYSISWLKKLVRYLHYMQFNLIHFRLTDDQAFNIRLESHPEFAKASAVDASNGTVYTPSELKELVDYAHGRNVTIMPEINVPGHAGAWHGIPGMLVPCPCFICSKGYGIPLNVDHPRLFPILKEMIVEIREIFHTSPFFHFGGDEVHMSKPCFDEAGIGMYDYEAFEHKLANVVKEAGVQEAVRWEMTGQQEGNVRLVSREHYWLTRKYARQDNGKVYPFFASQGLYFDSNRQTDGYSIYQTTRDYITTPKEDHPTAIIAGAFELGMDTWLDRNVLGRLLAVAMGASGIDFTAPPPPNTTTTASTNINKTVSLLRVRPRKTVVRAARPDPAARQNAFQKKYHHYCKALAFDSSLCSLYGRPYLSEEAYKVHWDGHWDKWKADICDKLTVATPKRTFLSNGRNLKTASSAASSLFWEGFMEHEESQFSESRYTNSSQIMKSSNSTSKLSSLLPHDGNSAIAYRGISLDLFREAPNDRIGERLKQIIDTIAELGLNLLQLRLMDDLGFILHLGDQLSLERVDDTVNVDFDYDKIILDIVEYARGKGIYVMPEISITTRSGGWSESLAHVQCPNVLCKQGRGLALDLMNPNVWPIMSVTIKFLRFVFSSKYIHLGFDERKESMPCFDEAQVTPDFDMFEDKLQEILRIERISPNHVIRWENTEQTLYEKRAGGVTHYRFSDGPATNSSSSSPWFVSIKLALDEPETTEMTGGDIYKHTRSLVRKSPTGIIASVGVLNATSWDMLNINGRLLAMALGLVNQTGDYSQEEFRSHFNRTCHSLSTGYHCDLFGNVNATKSWWTTRQEQAVASRIEQACSSRTQEIVERTARKGVLVE